MKQEEKKELIRLLGLVNPKEPLGTELFDALARITVSVAVEAVCLRYNNEDQRVEVYLTQRSKNDTAYPGQWHCPGSVLRPGEEEENVFLRLSQKEAGADIHSLGVIKNLNHSNEQRGHFFSVIHLCSITGRNDGKGKWFSVNNLPKNIVGHHRDYIIPMAVSEFEFRAQY